MMMKDRDMQYTFDEQIVSDLHKDAYGFRPREYFWAEWNNSTDDEKQTIWDGLCADLDAEIQREQQEQAAAVAHFEANVQRNMDLGAPSTEDAIRWILQSLDLSEYDLAYGGSYVCYELGLPYNMATTFDPIIKEMRG
jgi:hypothetical protein